MIEYFCKKWKAIKRAKNIRKIKIKNENKNKIPPYLKNNSFEEELNYKLWSTKGARFSASRRNHTLNKLSSKSIGYLSAYLIIIGVVNLYNINLLGVEIFDNEVGFISTAFSVLILLFSQLESSENFALKSERYHSCSLDISELYNRARFTKDFTTNPLAKQEELLQISIEYDRILKKYENHLQIDYLKFQLTKPNYFELSSAKIKWIQLKYYGKVYLVYHILIFGPLLILIIIALSKNNYY